MAETIQKILFVITLDGGFSIANSLDAIKLFVTKSKTDHDFIFINNKESKELEHLQQNKITADLISKGRFKFIPPAPGAALKDYFNQALNISEPHSHIIFTDLSITNYLNQVNSWYTVNKKNSTDLTILQVSSGKAGKNSLFSRLKSRIYDFLVKLAAPIAVKDISNSILIFHADKAKELLKGFTFGKNIDSFKLHAIYKSNLNNLSVGLFNLPVIKTVPFNHLFAKIFRLIFISISTRLEWFFTKPLKDLKDPAYQLSLWNGNHSFYRLTFFLLFVVLAIFVPYLSLDFGITWDEYIQKRYGYDILKYFQTFGADKTCLDESQHPLYYSMKLYGSFFDTLSAAFYTYMPFTDEMAQRHLLNSFFGFIAMAYTALIARVAGTWRTACIAFVIIFISPYFLGHSMNNPKDIPFATGYMMALYYLIRFLQQLPKPKFSTSFLLVLGIALMISIRIGGLILIGYLGLFTGVSWLIYTYKNKLSNSIKLVLPYFLFVAIIAFIAYLLGIVSWPYGIQKPFTNPLLALKSFTNYNNLYSYELFEGKRIYMKEVPWYYTFKLMFVMTPLFVWAGCTFAIAGLKGTLKRFDYAIISIIVFAFFFPILYAAYKHSTLYNGWRHMLFVYPLAVIVAAIGWDLLLTFLKKPVFKWSILLLFIVLISKTGFWMIKNHPNEYVYFNEAVGGIDGAYGQYETDSYANCMRQAVEWLAANEPVKHKKVLVVTNQESLASSYYADQLADSIEISWAREYEFGKQRWDYALFTTRTMPHSLITNGSFPPKGTIHVIKADNTPLVAIVKRENYYMPDGYEFLAQNKFDSAAYYFQKATEFSPKDEETHRMLATSYINQGNFASAQNSLNESLKLYPESFAAYYLQGILYLNTNKLEEAKSAFNSSIKYKINYSQSYYGLAKVYNAQKNFYTAIEYFEKTLKYGGGNVNIYNELGVAYFMNGDSNPMLLKNNYQKGISYLDASLKLNPNQSGVYQNLSVAYNKLGDVNTANKCYQKAMELKKAGV